MVHFLLWIHYNLWSLIWPLVWPSQTALSKLWALPFFGTPFSFSLCFPLISVFSSFVVSQYYFMYLFIYLLFSFLIWFSAVLYSLTVLFLSPYYYYYLLPVYFTFNFFCFCFINFIQASFLLFSLHFIFASVPISFFRLHCSIGTRLQAPWFSFSCTQNL